MDAKTLKYRGESEGDTAPAARPRWSIEGRHDAEVDRLLDKIDRERGHVESLVASGLLPAATAPGPRSVLLVIRNSREMEDAVADFVERLVRTMWFSDEEGGGTATRAYVIMRPLLMQLQRSSAEKLKVTISMQAAGSLRFELQKYLRTVTPDTGTPLGALYAALPVDRRGGTN